MAGTFNYVNLQNLTDFWAKAKDYIIGLSVNGSSFGEDRAVTLTGSNITVSGNGTYKSATVQGAIDALDTRLTTLSNEKSALAGDVAQLREDLDGEIATRGTEDGKLSGRISAIEQSYVKSVVTTDGTYVILESNSAANDAVNIKVDDSAIGTKFTNIDEYKVNSKKISTNPTLGGADIVVGGSGAHKASTVQGAIDALISADSTLTTTCGGLRTDLNNEITNRTNADDTIKAYTVNGKAISTNPVLSGDDVKLGVSVGDDTNYPTTKTISSSIQKLRETIAGLGQVLEFKGKFDSLPAVTGYENGDVVIVGNKEYILYNSAWVELGDVSELSQDVSTIKASYVKSIKGEGANGVSVTPTTSNGDVTIKVDGATLNNKFASYVAKAGDTMSGQLGVTHETTGSSPSIYGNGTKLTFGYASTVSQAVLDSTSFRRGTSATTTLGSSTYPWPTAYINEVVGNLTGIASSATKLAAKKTIALTGDVTGSAETDFSGNVSIKTTVADDSHSHSNYVPTTRKVNNKALSADITLAASDIGAVPTSGNTTISGVLTATGFSGPLTGNVIGNVSGSSSSCTGNAATAGSCTGNAATATKLAAKKTIALTGDVTGSAETDFSGNVSIKTTVADDSHSHSNYVPTTRKVNNKALSADITLAASDIGAVPISGNSTITGTETTPFSINTTATNGVGIYFQQNSTNKAWVGYNTAGKYAYLWTAAGPHELKINESGAAYVDSAAIVTANNYTSYQVDTKNTAGATDTSSKIFLIGATSQDANPQTYTHDTAFVGTDGCLYSTNFILTSDRNLKENIVEVEDASKSLDLKFYEYDYKNNGGHSAGNMAQDVQEIYPKLVHENDGKLSVDSNALHSLQIKALKDENDALKNEVKTLKETIKLIMEKLELA